MIIAFDFHGVLEAYPDKFKQLLQSLNQNHVIIVLSGPPLDQIYKELKTAGYDYGHFDHALSVVDWIKSQGHEMKLNEQGTWCCDDKIWWPSKARICEENRIDMLFDDKIRYKKYIKDDNPLFIHIQ